MIHLRLKIPVRGVNWSFGVTPSYSHGSHPGGQSTAGAEAFNKTLHDVHTLLATAEAAGGLAIRGTLGVRK